MKRRGRLATVGWLLLSAVVAAVLLVRVVTRPLADSLLELRVVNGASLEDLEPGSQYITHPTRGLTYSAGQLPFDVSELPNSKSICDWVYCPTVCYAPLLVPVLSFYFTCRAKSAYTDTPFHLVPPSPDSAVVRGDPGS